MPETSSTLSTDVRPRAEPCTLLIEARVVQGHLAGLGESVMVGDADALDVEDLCADAAAMMGRLIEALAEARKAALRCPPSPRPPGLPPVPPPAPWQPSAPVPAPPPARPSRRGVMAATAGLLALWGAVEAFPAEAASAGNPDAEMIAMCDRIVAAHEEMERLERPFYEMLGPPEHIREQSYVLVAEGHRLAEAVAEMHAATPEGMRAKARAMLTYSCMTLDGTPDWSNHDELLGWSIARDLLRGA